MKTRRKIVTLFHLIDVSLFGAYVISKPDCEIQLYKKHVHFYYHPKICGDSGYEWTYFCEWNPKRRQRTERENRMQ